LAFIGFIFSKAFHSKKNKKLTDIRFYWFSRPKDSFRGLKVPICSGDIFQWISD
jgi:hypothetical protein